MPSHRGWGKAAQKLGPHPDRKGDPTSPAKAEEVEVQNVRLGCPVQERVYDRASR